MGGIALEAVLLAPRVGRTGVERQVEALNVRLDLLADIPLGLRPGLARVRHEGRIGLAGVYELGVLAAVDQRGGN